ncbi:MAG TPA: hypothetical protein VFC96_02100, partial [Anaerovoracaceae bacterium]|nr:hypothetical protein [Anaerovoracaceae bacterium]
MSKLDTKDRLEIKLDLDELDITSAESKATYQEIKEHALDKREELDKLYKKWTQEKISIRSQLQDIKRPNMTFNVQFQDLSIAE